MKHIFSQENRSLLVELVRTDFKLRYQGSVLGYAWTLLKPLLLFLILYIVFVRFLRLGGSIPHYPIYLLLGIVLWNFFSEMTSITMSSIVLRGDLIRKIKIPHWIIILSSSLSSLINTLINILVVGVFMLFNKMDFSLSMLLLPVIMLEIYLLALGVSLFLSAAYVKFRDVSYAWEVILQAMFYITPILYPISIITNLTVQKILLLNPMAQAIQDARYFVVTDQTTTGAQLFTKTWQIFIPFALVLIIFVVSVIFFRKQSKYFAENI